MNLKVSWETPYDDGASEIDFESIPGTLLYLLVRVLWKWDYLCLCHAAGSSRGCLILSHSGHN